MPRRTNLGRLEELNESIGVKALFLDILTPPLPLSSLELRVCSKEMIGPASVVVYGNKYANLIPEGRQNFLIVTFNIVTVAMGYRQQFASIWNKAALLPRTGEDIRMARTAE
jgi:hypothetical protein